MARLTPERRHWQRAHHEPTNHWHQMGNAHGDLRGAWREDGGPRRLCPGAAALPPLVRWIWLGGLLMMTGGTLCLLARRPLLASHPAPATAPPRLGAGESL